ncbi:MAG: hypothetical protein U1F35_15445 [Steroidobacteraceae bacterium]
MYSIIGATARRRSTRSPRFPTEMPIPLVISGPAISAEFSANSSKLIVCRGEMKASSFHITRSRHMCRFLEIWKRVDRTPDHRGFPPAVLEGVRCARGQISLHAQGRLQSALLPEEHPILATAASNLTAAIDNASAVDYDAFAGQVLAYLEPDYQDHFGNKRVWNELRAQVVSGLQALVP